jgi:hypothetical protein
LLELNFFALFIDLSRISSQKLLAVRADIETRCLPNYRLPHYLPC